MSVLHSIYSSVEEVNGMATEEEKKGNSADSTCFQIPPHALKANPVIPHYRIHA